MSRTLVTGIGTPPTEQRAEALVVALKDTAREHLDDAYRKGWVDALYEFEMMLNGRAQKAHGVKLHKLRKEGLARARGR